MNSQTRTIKLPALGLYWALVLTLLNGPSLAQEEELALGDHPLMDRFPDSSLEEIAIVEDVSYRLVLGTLRRNREEVVPEDSQRLRGDVTKLTYQISQQFNGEDVYNFFRGQIDERGYQILFSCAGRACGSSNYWANDIFRNRILYGPERNQYFLALLVEQADAPPAHISLYIITRANRRIYAYLEIVEESVSSGVVELASPELLETLNERGAVSLPDLAFDSDDQLTEESNLQKTVELLQSNPEMQFYIVAHLDGDAPLPELMARSRVRAENVRRQLIARGVQASRLVAEGVGPLAPVCEIVECSERVELILR